MRHEIAAGVVNRAIKESINDDTFEQAGIEPGLIRDTLVSLGFSTCVAQEWDGEQRRRDYILMQRLNAMGKKTRSKFGSKGTYARRIIKTERRGDRLWELHATKGWRSYRY